MECGGTWAGEWWVKYCPGDLPLTACFSPITLVTVVINLVHLSVGAQQAEHQDIHDGPSSGHSQSWPLHGHSGPFLHFAIPSVPLFFYLKNIYCLYLVIILISIGEYQADEQTGVVRLRWRLSGR